MGRRNDSSHLGFTLFVIRIVRIGRRRNARASCKSARFAAFRLTRQRKRRYGRAIKFTITIELLFINVIQRHSDIINFIMIYRGQYCAALCCKYCDVLVWSSLQKLRVKSGKRPRHTLRPLRHLFIVNVVRMRGSHFVIFWMQI